MCRECARSQETQRGQAGRNPALRFARRLKQQGFVPTRHFVERFLQRALGAGLRYDPRTFRREFLAARHFRQTRSGYHTRIAVVRGVPILYRRGGWSGERIVLVGVLPAGARPPVKPVKAPSREALFEAWETPQAYAEQKARYQNCLNKYTPPPGARLPNRPGKTFRRAFRRPRQGFLSCQHLNPDAPRFMQGWYKQEERRRRLANRQRAKVFNVAGQQQMVARRKHWQAIATDPMQSAAARQWAAGQLQRLEAGQRRQQKLLAGRTQRKPNVRIVPGYDVGHPLGYVLVKGKWVARKAMQDPRTFRPEIAAQNQGRPAIANRGKLAWGYQESDPWG